MCLWEQTKAVPRPLRDMLILTNLSVCLVMFISSFSDWVGRVFSFSGQKSPPPSTPYTHPFPPPPIPGSNKIPPPPIGSVYQRLMQEVVFKNFRLDFLELYLKQPGKTPYWGGISIPNQKAYLNKITLTGYLMALFAVVCGVDRGLTLD